MLEIQVEGVETFNEATNEFLTVKTQTLKLEHSLVSISKWESKWKKPFINQKEKTSEEIIDYIRCMTINQVNPIVYSILSQKNIDDIVAYIDDPMTATTVNNIPGKKTNEAITSELIYYWMVSYEIPFECEKWHLNRLLALIKICNVKNQPNKKMSRRQVFEQNKALNAARRARLHTKG